ncbi:hypothetical protein JHK85_010822 [Glycine max]|nr:hypothetical protein JHK85_010822 [Glycine max]KAG5066800.1 hypothetical protein JHK86_010531 [Glycine max]
MSISIVLMIGSFTFANMRSSIFNAKVGIALSASFVKLVLCNRVGVDNMRIIVDAVKQQPSGLLVEEQISNAIARSWTFDNTSQLIRDSSICCRIICFYAIIPHFLHDSLVVLLDFLLQITAFVALVTLEFMRAKDNRINCFPCVKLNPPSTEHNEGDRRGKSTLFTTLLSKTVNDCHGRLQRTVVEAYFLVVTSKVF